MQRTSLAGRASGSGLAAWARPRPLLPNRPALRAAAAPAASASRRPAAPSPAPRRLAAPRGPAPPAASKPAPAAPFDPVRDFKRELGMQTNRLNPDVRERVERAVEALGYRATVGEVAARAGVKLSEADEALKALAYDALGHLEVSSGGEVVYSFDRGFRSTLRNRSWLQRLRPLWKRAQAVGAYLVRAAFGSALLVSVLVVWLAIVALMSSSRDNERRDSRGGGYGGGGFGLYIDPFDLFLWADPSYARRSRQRLEEGREMNFVEAVFSWVFGDGDPNLTFEERRWRALGRHIQKLGGVVSAEELAPFLDPPRLPRRLPSGPNKYEDEAFVLPALIRLGGEPFVDERGGLLYRFPALQVAASELPRGQQQAVVPLEREWEFSAASPGQQAGALALGVLNVVGVVVLSTMLADPIAKLSLYRQGLGFVLGLLPYLQGYAGAFFAIPLVRALVDGRRNKEIEGRNDARLQAVELLQSGGDRDLDEKLAAARKLGSSRVIGRQDVVYTTEQGTAEQFDRMEAEEFDRKLGRQQQQQRRQEQRQLPERGSERRIDDVFGRRRERDAQYQAEERGRGRMGGRRDDWDDLDRW